MAALVGRTPSKFMRVVIHDANGVLREPNVAKIGNAGLIYPFVDLTSIQDAIKGGLSGQPGWKMALSGPLDDSPLVAASASTVKPALSGAHLVFAPLNGLLIPLSFAILIGMRAYYETGAPAFGIVASSVSGMIVTSYEVVQNGEAMEYNATLEMYPGSDAPSWIDAIPTQDTLHMAGVEPASPCAFTLGYRSLLRAMPVTY